MMNGEFAKKYITIVTSVISLASIIFIILSGPILAFNPIHMALQLGFAFIAIWSLKSWSYGFLFYSNYVRKNTRFVIHGPYKIVRHPLNLSILFICLTMVHTNLTITRILVWVILFITLHFRMVYIEKRYLEAWGAYKNYANSTARLVPYIY